ncbi:hypothetical protein VI817_007914 [Penicillium citrinum]|nr:hypothetical protein VI817_007914 [Penicillium citrinum]
MTEQQLHPSQYTIGWISALPVELAAVQELLDEKHEAPSRGSFGTNIYTVGRIAGHNVAIAALPFTQIGPSPAAWVAAQMKVTFPNIQVTLMVGVGGGAPREGVDVRLGDVVIGRPNQAHGGIVQYDSGKATTNGFQRTGFLNNPPSILLKAITQLEASHLRGQEVHMEYLSQLSQQFCRDRAGPDVLFRANYDHVDGETCAQCDKANSIARPPRDKEVMIHYGTIASGNKVMKNGRERDRISHELGGVMCFEMEAAGLVNDLPCLVIRGICDYADSHKNKSWQGYASATAAACAKALLFMTPKIPPSCDSPIQQRHHFARKRRLKCLTWLSCSAYRRTHQRILRAIIPCTSTWLLSRHEFMRWKNEQHSALFWLQGPSKRPIGTCKNLLII